MKPLQGSPACHGFTEAGLQEIKSDNIVVDFDEYGTFSRIKPVDLDDSVRIEPTTGHPFTHPIYGVLVRW